MIPTICTALVIWAKAEVFDLKPLIYIGEVSFTLYLVHWPIILLLGNGTQNIHGINIVVTLLLMVIATMALSIFIEIPFRNQVFGVISLRGWLVILTLATVIAQLVYLLPGKSGIALDLSKPAVYTNGCHLDQRHAKLNTNCTWGNSDAQKVLLVGDSHAAQWFPALKKLADGGAINLTSQTKSSCPATLNQVYAAGQIDKSCNTWHQNIINLIKSSNFDYIYFSNFDNYGYRTSSNWNAGIDNFVAIASAKSKVIQILDIPKPPSDLVACLSTNSKNLSACDFAAPRTLRLVNPNVTYLDPTPWLCDVGICSAYKDGVNVYRDGSHLSVTTAEKLSERLRAP
jgi:hypothetical protein